MAETAEAREARERHNTRKCEERHRRFEADPSKHETVKAQMREREIKRRADPEKGAVVRERDLKRNRIRRADPMHHAQHNEQNREYMRRRREDPGQRGILEAQKQARLADPAYREAEMVKARERAKRSNAVKKKSALEFNRSLLAGTVECNASAGNTPWLVYRFFGRGGALLYVGETVDFKRRYKEHRLRADWFRFAVRYELKAYPNVGVAKASEAIAIVTEKPLFNFVHNDSDDMRALR
jgi:hypothetical protein